LDNEVYPAWALDFWKFVGVASGAYLVWGWRAIPWVAVAFGVLAFLAAFVQGYMKRKKKAMTLGKAAAWIEDHG
jgi:hypothetical protein